MTISAPAVHRTLPEADAQANRQLTTLDGWRRFLASSPEPPVRTASEEWQRLSSMDRDLYDEARLDHHARMLVVATSFVEKTVTCGTVFPVPGRPETIRPRRALIACRLSRTSRLRDPRPHRPLPRRPNAIDPVQPLIDSMIEAGHGPTQIWAQLMDEHDTSISHGIIRRHVHDQTLTDWHQQTPLSTNRVRPGQQPPSD